MFFYNNVFPSNRYLKKRHEKETDENEEMIVKERENDITYKQKERNKIHTYTRKKEKTETIERMKTHNNKKRDKTHTEERKKEETQTKERSKDNVCDQPLNDIATCCFGQITNDMSTQQSAFDPRYINCPFI